MNKKFTLNDLFLYHYNELAAEEHFAVAKLIASDSVFEKESNKIIAMKQLLNSEMKEPSLSSIQFIMNHDKKSSNELAY